MSEFPTGEFRQSPKWMVLLDDRILEVMDHPDTGEFWTPSDMANTPLIDYTREYVNHRMQMLTLSGLAERISRGVYRIDDPGREYLRCEYDPSDGPNPT